jgi:endoglucanase
MRSVVGPGNDFAFEVHQYFDVDSSGTSPKVMGARIGSERIESIQRGARNRKHEYLPTSRNGSAAGRARPESARRHGE